MEVNTIKLVSDKCFGAIDKCAQIDGESPKHVRKVAIYKHELEVNTMTQKLMDEVTGLMKSFGIQYARYQRNSQRFFGLVSDEAIVSYKQHKEEKHV